MPSEPRASPKQTCPHQSTSPVRDVINSFDTPPAVQALPQSLLRSFIVTRWTARATGHRPQAPPQVEIVTTPEAAGQVCESPLAHLLADLTTDDIVLKTGSIDESTPALVYTDDRALTPVMVSRDEPFFVEMHPPRGAAIAPTKTSVTPAEDTTPGSAIYAGFEDHIPRADPASLTAAYRGYTALDPSTDVGIGYLLVVAGSCTGVLVRDLGEWAEAAGVLSLEAIRRRTRRLKAQGLVKTEQEPTGSGGNNVTRVELAEDPDPPDTEFKEDLDALVAATKTAGR
jgi:hypothetical protein